MDEKQDFVGRMKNLTSVLQIQLLGRVEIALSGALLPPLRGKSGLWLLAFARKHHLCYSTLIRWRGRQPKEARPAAGPVAAVPGFIPIRIEPGSLSADYVVSWPGGRSLRIPPCFEPQSLSRLLQVLEEQE